nr:MAG TPA: hypothetical protein [Caudoviricetes sp.]
MRGIDTRRSDNVKNHGRHGRQTEKSVNLWNMTEECKENNKIRNNHEIMRHLFDSFK